MDKTGRFAVYREHDLEAKPQTAQPDTTPMKTKLETLCIKHNEMQAPRERVATAATDIYRCGACGVNRLRENRLAGDVTYEMLGSTH